VIYKFTPKELKQRSASEFQHDDLILVSKYAINIRYKIGEKYYNNPSWLTTVSDRISFKLLDCTPGAGWPYYIAAFINR